MRAILALTLLAACTPETTDAPDDTSDTSDTDDTPAGPDITVAAEDLATLRDAAPNADGSRIWYVADRAPGDAALFEAGTSTAIAGGFVRLDNLVLSSDATRAWVTGEGDAGPVLASITLATGAVEEVEAAAAYEPLGLDLTVEAGADTLWFSGFDPDSGEVGVFRLDPSTGAITPFATADLDAPGGLTRGADGAVWLAGAGAAGGEVHRLDGSSDTTVNADVILGDPAGVALTSDGSTLLVSSLSADGTSQALLIDTTTHAASVFNAVIGVNHASGGLHRALDGDVFAWADSEASGKVYRIRL